jgi:hypothetical protein
MDWDRRCAKASVPKAVKARTSLGCSEVREEAPTATAADKVDHRSLQRPFWPNVVNCNSPNTIVGAWYNHHRKARNICH